MKELLILGASVRVAVLSARLANIEPWGIDLFADWDTQQLCKKVGSCPIERYPGELFQLARSVPAMPWIYTGGLENYPDLIEKLSQERLLLGNPASKLVRVRDPFWLKHSLQDFNVATPEILPGSSPGTLGRWLRKPFRSSGGLGIRVHHPGDIETYSRSYLQQYLAGESCSLLLLTRGESTSNLATTPLAWTQQLSGVDWLNARPFQYAGNVGPLAITDERIHNFAVRIARWNDQVAGLVGLWGIDFLMTSNGPCVLEVNPRITAAEELLHRSGGQSGLKLWFDAQIPETMPWNHYQARPHERIVAKGVYYAPRKLKITNRLLEDIEITAGMNAGQLAHFPFADIPHAGTVIETGHPVLTLIAKGHCCESSMKQLQRQTEEFSEIISIQQEENSSC